MSGISIFLLCHASSVVGFLYCSFLDYYLKKPSKEKKPKYKEQLLDNLELIDYHLSDIRNQLYKIGYSNFSSYSSKCKEDK